MAESDVPEISLLSFMDALREGRGKEIVERVEKADYYLFTVYAMPVPRLRIRAYSKRLVWVEPERLARLEYALWRALLEAAREGRNPAFQEVARLAGDYKAAAGYVSFLWLAGLVKPSDHAKMLDLYRAYNSHARKGYEHRISRALDLQISLDRSAVENLAKDTIPCVYSDGTVLCKYVLANTPRLHAKAQARAFRDVAASL